MKGLKETPMGIGHYALRQENPMGIGHNALRGKVFESAKTEAGHQNQKQNADIHDRKPNVCFGVDR